MQSESDELLLEQIRHRDREALARLYERYKLRLFRFCFRLLRNEAQAEDAVHDTFIKVCNGADAVVRATSFRAWMFQIARNEALMNLRRRKESSDSDPDGVWDEHTPLTLLVEKDMSELVQRFVDGLKVEYREVVLLREFEQLSYEEIARVLGVSESSVKSRLFKARHALAKELEPALRERTKL